MQNEITELRNQVRTLKRIACLAVMCLIMSGCSLGSSISAGLGQIPAGLGQEYNEMTGEWE